MSVFYYDYRNIQVTQVLNTVQTIINGAQATLYGVDLDFEAKLAPGLRLSGGFEALHATFDDFPNAVFGTPKPTGGALIAPGNAAGKRLPLSQKLVAQAAIDYDTLVSFGRLHFNLAASYNGGYKFEPDNFLGQGNYVNINSSVRWSNAADTVDVSLFVRNLLNNKVIQRSSTQGQGSPTIYGYAPRTYGVAVGLRF